MKKFLAIIGLSAIFGLSPFISFAQNEGDYCGGFNPVLCGVGLTCQLFSVGGDAGTCVSAGTTNGGNNNPPPPPAVPELPVWYQWLTSWFSPPQAPAITPPVTPPTTRPATAPIALTFATPSQQTRPCGRGSTNTDSNNLGNGAACAYKPGGCDEWDPNSPTGKYLACGPNANQKYKKAWDDSVQATKDAISNAGIDPTQQIAMRLLASHGDFGTVTYSFEEVVRLCSYDSYKYTSPTCQNRQIQQFNDVMQKEADAKQKADRILKKDLADCEDSKPDDLYENPNECITRQSCVGP